MRRFFLNRGETDTREFSKSAAELLEVVGRIDHLLKSKGELCVDSSETRSLEFIVGLVTIETSTNLVKAFENSSVKHRDASLLRTLMNTIQQDKIDFTKREQPITEWWNDDYFHWFLLWVADAASKIADREYPSRKHELANPEIDFSNVLTKNGFAYFTRDRGGHGRTYLPALFFVTWYAKVFEIPNREELERQFEKQTLIPFDAFLISLRSGGSWR